MTKTWADVLNLIARDGQVKPVEAVADQWLIERFEGQDLNPPTLLELAAPDAFEQYAIASGSSARQSGDEVAYRALVLFLEAYLAVESRATRLVMDASGLHPFDRLPYAPVDVRPQDWGRLKWVAAQQNRNHGNGW